MKWYHGQPGSVTKEPLEQGLGLLAALLGQPDGFVLVLGIGDQALLMEPIERFPVVPLPGAGEGELPLPFRKVGQVAVYCRMRSLACFLYRSKLERTGSRLRSAALMPNCLSWSCGNPPE